MDLGYILEAGMESANFSRRIDESCYDADSLPTYPARVLAVHVAQKGVQAGALGGLLMVPVISYLRKLPLRTAWTRVMVPAPFIGTAISLSMLFAMDYYKPMGLEGVDDRAFRIMNNAGQVKVDKYSTVALAAGAAIGAVTIGGLSAILAGASTGVAAGVGVYSAEKAGWVEKLKEFKLPEINKE
eukprot:gene27343-30907_t